ncbi:metallophosphoesterase family protein [Sagittula sp. SSi028]|uniref:metallophosphoesterase family protein n=1 Tax=Sagittula sp. SSi028 TaxID=3400636 RepID=UPI003AF48B8A
MKRVLHLSDLHYGKDRADLEEPLLDTIHQLQPDLVAISGDFTQRARRRQFARARAFLDRLQVPWLAVPGNHDTPLDNLWVRLTKPWQRYRQAIHEELEPVYQDEGMVVVGINTVNRFAWQRGRLSDRRVTRACRAFLDDDPRARLVMLHHPLQHGPEVEKRLMRGADEALQALAGCGAQIVLSGHLHNTIIAPFRAWPELLFVQAGTCLSSRVRGETNMFNLLDLWGDQVRVQSWGAIDGVFDARETWSYRLDGGHWQRV